ncbi:pantetheine-phosphate adenylyltransferase [Actinoplanes sp. NPDC051494]|uniref:pantetheine-phosphate adenylyltransferase n=1 Tax=Actinoplanes sp. NPDC051494 TaxID=3363907 RepID=UPI0037ACB73B
MSSPAARNGDSRPGRAAYPGTFDPFTPGHFDIADRARRLFDQLTIVVAVNDSKRPTRTTTARANRVRAALPAEWENVTVAAWHGLTVDYCHRHGCGVIVRGVRNSTDFLHEYQLAAMNETMGVTTLLLPARPQLTTMSSTAVRTLQT